MTLTRAIVIAVISSFFGILQAGFTPPNRSIVSSDQQVLNEVKRYYSMECSRNTVASDPYVSCADVLRFIKKFEGKR